MYEITRSKYLIEHEYNQLLRTLARFKNSDIRNTNLIYLSIFTGARASEILLLEDYDLNRNDRTVSLFGLKNSRSRTLPIPAWLFDRLANNPLKSHDKLFPITYRRFSQIWDLYKPCNKGIHCLRHTFALRLYAKTKDIKLVQLALGHKSLSSTMVYSDFVYSQEQMKRVLIEDI